MESMKPIRLRVKIEKTQEGRYIPIPFVLEKNIERIDVRYSYSRYEKSQADGFTMHRESSIIDLAIEAPGGEFIGASGSDRAHVWVSPLGSSAGFSKCEITPGTWHIIAGAYKVPEGGVTVEYEILLTRKKRRLFRGDTHLHTHASDGAADIAGTINLARQQGLDFLIITDHNNFKLDGEVPLCHDITVIHGTEWTHYRGHAGILGVQRPYRSPYYTESVDETVKLMQEARENGAMVVLNHPFCPLVPWQWGFDLPYDGIEVWNGVMSERNERAIGWWHKRLCAGERLPATGGSDYHRAGLFGGLAMPCMFLYALSRSPEDIMDALRRGSGYISYLAGGPGADMVCRSKDAEYSFGDLAPSGSEVEITFFGLRGMDELKIITDLGEENIYCPGDAVSCKLTRSFPGARFVRLEVYRSYAPGLPPMRAMLTNPIYFD
jgi:hypothetical protein